MTTLVLLHGTRMNGGFWQGYDALLPEVDVVAPDLPGHGSRTGEEFTWDGALEAVDAVMPDGPTVLVGHSLGGYLAMAYAARHPHRLAGLGVVGATAIPRGPGAAVYRGFARLVPAVGPDRVARVSNALMRRLAGGRDLAHVTDGGAGYAAMPAAWAAVMSECGPHLLRHVDCPVLLLNGRLDQLRIDARRFAAECGDVEVVTVPGATHFLPVTHPEQCAGALRRLVERSGANTRR